MRPLLTLDRLTVRRGGVAVVADVSLRVMPGSFVSQIST